MADETNQNGDPIISVSGLTYRYVDRPDLPPVLENVNLEVRKDDFVGLIGPNGSGKTTLLRILMGAIRPKEGRVRVLGKRPAEVSRRIGYVPQHAHIDTEVPATVLDVVRTGRLGLSKWGLRYGKDHDKAVRAAMDEVGVADLAGRRIGELSGGQRQRVLIARALAADVGLLLLDEPMAGVDIHMERGILKTLQRLNESLPIILVSHDIGSVSRHVNRVACLNRRLVVHRPEEMSVEIISDMYAGDAPVRHLHHHDDCPFSEACDE
jgi:zinc transport system ATP-binding protein